MIKVESKLELFEYLVREGFNSDLICDITDDYDYTIKDIEEGMIYSDYSALYLEINEDSEYGDDYDYIFHTVEEYDVIGNEETETETDDDGDEEELWSELVNSALLSYLLNRDEISLKKMIDTVNSADLGLLLIPFMTDGKMEGFTVDSVLDILNPVAYLVPHIRNVVESATHHTKEDAECNVLYILHDSSKILGGVSNDGLELARIISHILGI